MGYQTKTFKSGNSEAVRLPKGLGFGIGVDLHIERNGDRIVLTPRTDAAEKKRLLLELLADLDAIGAPDDGVQPRPDIEWPERPGL